MLYRPYHAALAALVEETMARFGVAIVVDCHSMPSALAVPDIVLGDRYGASAPPALTGMGGTRLCRRGFQPGAQCALCRRLYHRALWPRRRGCHALQIEINRSLYLDEDSMARRGLLRRGAEAADARR